MQTLRRRMEKNLPATKIDYVSKGPEDTIEKRVGMTSLPRELITNSSNLLRLCVRNSLAELHRYYWLRHFPNENYPGTSGFSLELSSDTVTETRVAKRRLHILSVTFQGCSQPVPW